MDQLFDRHFGLDNIEKAGKLLMAMPLHAATDDSALEHIESGEELRPVALVVMGHGLAAALLDRQTRLGAVEGLGLRLLVERQHNGVGRRVDIEANDVAQLGGKGGIIRDLEQVYAMGCKPWARQIRCTERMLMPTDFAVLWRKRHGK